MIPDKNENIPKQKIKIQLTSDNKCIIRSTIESAEKSKNTINKSDYSINIPDINDNDLFNISKSINSIQNDISITKTQNDGNSNLLISFSNISELNKTNFNENSINVVPGEAKTGMGVGGYSDVIDNFFKNLKNNENKENIDINKESADDIVNIKPNNKSKLSGTNITNKIINKSKEKKNVFDIEKNTKKYIKINRKENSNKINLIHHKKPFKNINSETTDNANTTNKMNIQKNNKSNFNRHIASNISSNFSFGTNNFNTNNNDITNDINASKLNPYINNNDINNVYVPFKNDDYSSPTFNIKFNFNSSELNNSNNNKNLNHKEKEKNNSIKNKNKNNSFKKKINKSIQTNENKNNDKKKVNLSYKKIELNNNNNFTNQRSFDSINLNKGFKGKSYYIKSNQKKNKGILTRLNINNNSNRINKSTKMTKKISESSLISFSSPKRIKENNLKNIHNSKSNSNSISKISRNLISTSKILVKNKSSSSRNIKSNSKTKTSYSNLSHVSNLKQTTDMIKNANTEKIKIKLLTKDKKTQSAKCLNTKNLLRKSPNQSVNKFSYLNNNQNKSRTKNNSKEKIMKENIFKTSLNTYRKSEQDNHKNNNTIHLLYKHNNSKNKDKSKNNSLIYNRKRNINNGCNKIINSSNNSSINKSLHSYNDGISKKHISIYNIFIPKLNQNKKNGIRINNNKQLLNKNFVVIQNFSRYKKKSDFFNKNKNNNTYINNNSNYYVN